MEWNSNQRGHFEEGKGKGIAIFTKIKKNSTQTARPTLSLYYYCLLYLYLLSSSYTIVSPKKAATTAHNSKLLTKMKYISVFLLLVASVLGEWQGCIQENQEDNKVTKGQSTPVCLNVAINAGNWADQTSFRTYSFTPEADDYSRFIIAGCKCYIALVISITMWQCWNCSF